jgi:hypothetical protein
LHSKGSAEVFADGLVTEQLDLELFFQDRSTLMTSEWTMLGHPF